MKKVREDMMVSYPRDVDRSLSFPDVVVREFEKLVDGGRISPAVYSQAIDRVRGQAKILNNIYSGRANGLQQAIIFILRQIR